MAAAICVTEIITNSFDSGVSMDEFILLVIVLAMLVFPMVRVTKTAHVRK